MTAMTAATIDPGGRFPLASALGNRVRAGMVGSPGSRRTRDKSPSAHGPGAPEVEFHAARPSNRADGPEVLKLTIRPAQSASPSTWRAWPQERALAGEMDGGCPCPFLTGAILWRRWASL
jgi:hypothetical protein